MILNDAQNKVVHSRDHFVFLLACAGSGKTRVIVEKIKLLLREGQDPSKILAITFTRKSALEMKHRVGCDEVRIHTFHQFAHMELKTHRNYDYDILDDHMIPFSKEQQLKFSIYKNSNKKGRSPLGYKRYERYMVTNKLKDFDDLLIDYQKMDSNIKKRFTHIFVDEFQDTNELQYDMLKNMIHQDIYVLAVGDPDQSIYQFRGSNDQIIERYIKDFHATHLMLTENYRSTSEILSYANRLILKNNPKFKKKMITQNDETGIVKYIQFIDLNAESEYIVSLISTLLMTRVKPHDIAIIYRNHHRSYDLRHCFRLKDIDFSNDEEKKEAIHFLSIHQSKGLEFQAVILIGLEENEIPSKHTIQLNMLKEERRLLFVGMTRAKKYLYLTSVTHGAFGIYHKPSIFVKDCGF